jgi:hypothetical protein
MLLFAESTIFAELSDEVREYRIYAHCAAHIGMVVSLVFGIALINRQDKDVIPAKVLIATAAEPESTPTEGMGNLDVGNRKFDWINCFSV